MSNLFRGNGRVILARDYGYKPLFNNGVSLTTGFCDVDRRRVVVQYPRCSLRSPPPSPPVRVRRRQFEMGRNGSCLVVGINGSNIGKFRSDAG